MGFLPRQTEDNFSKEDLLALEEEIRRKKMLTDETRKRLEESGCSLDTASGKILPTTVPSVVSPRGLDLGGTALDAPYAQTQRVLRPKDVISWVSNFDISGNIRIYF